MISSRGDQETRARSGEDDDVRVAGNRRYSLSRAASDVSCWEVKRGSASPKYDANGSRKALDDARERLTAESLAAKGAFFYQRVEDNAFHVVDLRS